MVDYIEGKTYGEVDLDEDPVIIPSCGHILTVFNMDGHLDMAKYYIMSPEGRVRSPVSGSQPFSNNDLKACPMCRAPLRNINRYNRIVKRGLLDEATKRFIVWSNAKYVPLTDRMFQEEERLKSDKIVMNGLDQDTNGASFFSVLTEDNKLHINGPRNSQLRLVRHLSGLSLRHAPTFDLRREINTFLGQVSEGEQPFARVHQMVQNSRRIGLESDFEFDTGVLQTRHRLLATSLSIRCDLSILCDLIKVFQEKKPIMMRTHAWMKAELVLDLSHNRLDSLALVQEAINLKQPMVELEARLFFVKFVVLERASSANMNIAETLSNDANEQIRLARSVVKASSSTASMLAEIEDTERLLRGSTFIQNSLMKKSVLSTKRWHKISVEQGIGIGVSTTILLQ
ncbi:hypothetical protein MMC12_006045 [Toensbergia leucococca]|nr:hypothetical protein [Toensbergia leucococca]